MLLTDNTMFAVTDEHSSWADEPANVPCTEIRGECKTSTQAC